MGTNKDFEVWFSQKYTE